MSLIITGVFDGPLTGGVPKGVELYVTADVPDLSVFGVGSANNGGGTDGEEFTFPAVAAAAGTYLYIASEAVMFEAFMGFAPDYTAGAMSINGDDAIEVFENGSVIDIFGDINVDGSGEAWEYLDGWAARNPGSEASAVFDVAQWSFSGPDALDGETTNAAAVTPIPLAAFDTVTPPGPTPTFVINELDADQDSTDSAEFVEIYDGGVGNASLDGLSLVLFNGNGEAAYNTISLDGRVTNADGFFVVGSASVPNVDLVAFTTNGLQNGADAVALYDGFQEGAPATENLLDAVVYGNGDPDDAELLALLGQTVQFDEGANGAATADALARQPDGDGGFTAQAPTPGASNFIDVVAPPTEITLISDIQGSGGTQNGAIIGTDDRSALEGQIVTVSAIVTADFQDGLFGLQGDLNGFYIQEEQIDYDFDDLSSEGIFIFDGTAPAVDVNIGDLVEVTGTVSEFFGQTQISATDVTVVAMEQVVPDRVDVVFPTAGVMDDGSGDFVANLEAYEGMLVNIAQDMTVSELFNLDRFGQYNVTSDGRLVQFSQDNAPDAAGNAQHLEDVAARTLVLDDGSSAQNPAELAVIDGNDGVLGADDSFRMGDTISAITGVIGYSFGEFRIEAAEGVYAQANPRDETPEDTGGNFKVASLNVLNYFTTIDETGVTTDNGSDPRGADSPEEFERQAEKLVNAIVAIDADVLGLVEIENDFAGEDFAIMDLVGRVNAALGEEVYGFVDPGQEFVGGDAISNGLIYKVGNVAVLGDMAILESFEGRDFIDPLDAGRGLNRPAIAQTFEDLNTGETLTVSVNHLKSKGSLSGLEVDEDQGDGQGNNNGTRTEAASILGDWLASDPTGQGSENTLILGDLNAYAKEDPLTVLAEAGYTDIAAEILGDAAYSYVFDGQIGTLDYVLANEALNESVVGVTEWHVNSDEADALDYNLDFGRDPALFNGDSAARNSDHDPVIVSFAFEIQEEPLALLIGTEDRDVLVGTDIDERIEGLGDNDKLFGNGGDDLIIGGAGKDYQLVGGEGADIFAFGAGDDVGVVRDFEDGVDLLQFTGGIGFGDLMISQNANLSRYTITGPEGYDVRVVVIYDDAATALTEADFVFAELDPAAEQNGAPMAEDDAVATLAGDAVTFDVLTNDTDPDMDVLSIVSVDFADNQGVLTQNDDGSLTYDPGDAFSDLLLGFNEEVIFEYTVTDGALTDTARVSVVLTGTFEDTGQSDLTVIQGTENRDTLIGLDVAERIEGLAGSDKLFGNGGDDIIIGGQGKDYQLVGGEGSDVFVFNAGDDVGVIRDFEDGQDRLQFTGGLQFSDLTIVQNAALSRFTVTGPEDYDSKAVVIYQTDMAALTVEDFIFT